MYSQKQIVYRKVTPADLKSNVPRVGRNQYKPGPNPGPSSDAPGPSSTEKSAVLATSQNIPSGSGQVGRNRKLKKNKNAIPEPKPNCPLLLGPELVQQGTFPVGTDVSRSPDHQIIEEIIRNWFNWGKTYDKLVHEGRNIPEKTMMRQHEIPSFLRFTQPVKIFPVLLDKRIYLDGNDCVIPTVTVSGPTGSSVGLTCQDYNVPMIDFLVQGARLWFIIKRSGNINMELFVAKLFKKEPVNGCLHGNKFLIAPKLFEDNDIDYEMVIQREQDTILTLPGIYFSWMNIGDGITASIRVPFAMTSWFKYAKKTKNLMCSCLYQNGIRKFQIDWERTDAHYQNGLKHGVHSHLSPKTETSSENLKTLESNKETGCDQQKQKQKQQQIIKPKLEVAGKCKPERVETFYSCIESSPDSGGNCSCNDGGLTKSSSDSDSDVIFEVDVEYEDEETVIAHLVDKMGLRKN